MLLTSCSTPFVVILVALAKTTHTHTISSILDQVSRYWRIWMTTEPRPSHTHTHTRTLAHIPRDASKWRLRQSLIFTLPRGIQTSQLSVSCISLRTFYTLHCCFDFNSPYSRLSIGWQKVEKCQFNFRTCNKIWKLCRYFHRRRCDMESYGGNNTRSKMPQNSIAPHRMRVMDGMIRIPTNRNYSIFESIFDCMRRRMENICRKYLCSEIAFEMSKYFSYWCT